MQTDHGDGAEWIEGIREGGSCGWNAFGVCVGVQILGVCFG